MNTEAPSPYANHDQVSLLLPWYANDSLDAAEREQVAAHLRVCLSCRQELAGQAALAKRLRHDPLLEISAKPSFERLMRRIDADAQAPVHRQSPPRGKTAWLADWIASLTDFPAKPRLAAVAAAMLLALALPLLLTATPPGGQPAYHTVADAGSLDRFTRDDLRVVFADQATKQDIDRLISAIQGKIVDGPSPAGVYTIRLAGGGAVEPALAQLRGSQSVVFAEPALPQAAKPGQGG